MRFVLISLALCLSCVVYAQGVMKLLVQSSPLAGAQYYAADTLWDDLRVGDAVALVREPGNAHDANAVRIDWRGTKLGYLPRIENAAVAAALDRGELLEGRIAALVKHKNPWRRVRIDVFVRL